MSKKFLFTTRLFVGFLSVLAVLFTVLPCAGQALAAPDVRTQFSFAQDEHGSAIACLSIRIPAGYHAYAHDPGDVGRPASLSLLLDGATLPCPVYYPAGALQRDYYDKEATVHVYEGEQLFFVPLHREDAGSRYSATLSLLLCSSLNCTPLDVTLRGTIPENLPDLATKPWKDQWLAISAEAAPVQGSAPEASLGLSMADGPATPVQALPGDNAADLDTPPLAESATALVEEDPLPAPAGFNFHISPVFADTSVEIYGLGKALLLGILAGLLLNVMPCVLPVLTFKVTGLLMANAHGKESLTRFREHNICFAAGILTLFTVLALAFGAMDLMWGQLYQSQEFLLIILMLVFLMGLSMLGVFTLPVIDFKAVNRAKNPRLQAYLTGLISTFLATPCSGPLLGGVLGWAFTQPMVILVVVFWAVGLGMALPYLILCIWPSLVHALPRPGRWMEMLEHVLGFLLLGTALYLLSILPDEKHIPILVALLVTTLAAFLWGKTCTEGSSRLCRRAGGAIFVLIIGCASFFALQMERTPTNWTEFNPRVFSSSLGNRPMVVEFTADWCPNCKFVEATVFTEERLKSLRAAYDVDFIRVDLTDANAHGTKLLEMLGSRSIPLTALFPAGDRASQPTVLRDVFTGASFDKAARETFVQ